MLLSNSAIPSQTPKDPVLDCSGSSDDMDLSVTQ